MRSWVVLIVSLSMFLWSCGATVLTAMEPGSPPAVAGMPAYEGDLVVQPERAEGPTLELRVPIANEHSTLGWGALHLWARPRHDHVGATALLDAPSEHARWTGCDSIDLRIDQHVERIPVRYVGRAMEGSIGHYDAVQLHFDLITLRKVARARRVTGIACGDRFEITPAQRDSFDRFVEWFDHLATPGQLRDSPWFREVGPRLELLPLEEDGDDVMEG